MPPEQWCLYRTKTQNWNLLPSTRKLISVDSRWNNTRNNLSSYFSAFLFFRLGLLRHMYILILSLVLLQKKQWILIIWRLHICKFIYLLKFICKTKSTLGVSSGLFLDMHRWTKSLSCPKYTLPAKAENDTFHLYPLYYKQTFFLQTS